ncbi:hypothetical protein KIW84_021423 [Lathyrus oleraceus]|uniref:Uncharacterized protein n=1 Tax=Pisum sativum TaxID=3888 RepID=A0A9D4Y874_PEA|nr:hypothetical protein KIW84_021423 [Pisum sativum]
MYNMMFAFTYSGAKMDNCFNNGRGHPTFRIQVQEVNQPHNDVHVDESFPEINLAQSNGLNVQVNQNAASQVDALEPEINMAQEHGLVEQVNQHV